MVLFHHKEVATFNQNIIQMITPSSYTSKLLGATDDGLIIYVTIYETPIRQMYLFMKIGRLVRLHPAQSENLIFG